MWDLNQVVLVAKNLPANAEDVKRDRFNPWVDPLGRSPGGGQATYSTVLA